ncbi:MAG: hypothetical protein ACLS9Q_08135 [[Clostridium] scindens]|uniref:hypothetical protein n=1 Tax=Clostridium scindens (strain JCM 10418 / VPI 12708) TaxID=29347 RepID=UPI003994A82E
MLKIVDGLREKPHVTSNDHFGRNEGIVGISDYVLNVGRMFETELISSNALRIYDGEGMIQGCHWRILPGTYETVTLSNGTQGKKRIDYVVARYEKNSVGYEDIGISVKEGEATSENPKPPAYITGDIRAGDTIREMVLAEIEYEGINVVEVTPKFKVLMTMAELQEKTDELNRKLVFLDQNAQNSSVNGWTLIRNGNIVTFKHNKVLSGVIAGHSYSNQGKIPEGYRPAIDITLPGDRIIGATITGSFYVSIGPAGNTNFVSDGNHNENQSYVASGAYITSDLFPLNDIPKVEI